MSSKYAVESYNYVSRMVVCRSAEQNLSAFKQIVGNYLNVLSNKRVKALEVAHDEPEYEFSCDHCGGDTCVNGCVYGYDTEEYWEFLNGEGE